MTLEVGVYFKVFIFGNSGLITIVDWAVVIAGVTTFCEVRGCTVTMGSIRVVGLLTALASSEIYIFKALIISFNFSLSKLMLAS